VPAVPAVTAFVCWKVVPLNLIPVFAEYVVSVAAIVTLSLVASGVIVILLPATNSIVSVVVSAAIVVLPTFTLLKAF